MRSLIHTLNPQNYVPETICESMTLMRVSLENFQKIFFLNLNFWREKMSFDCEIAHSRNGAQIVELITLNVCEGEITAHRNLDLRIDESFSQRFRKDFFLNSNFLSSKR